MRLGSHTIQPPVLSNLRYVARSELDAARKHIVAACEHIDRLDMREAHARCETALGAVDDIFDELRGNRWEGSE